MHVSTPSAETGIRRFLESFDVAAPWLAKVGFEDPQAAHRNFIAIAERGIPLDLLKEFRDELEKCLPGVADADRSLNNFERMLGKVRSPLSLITFLLRKRHSTRVLLQMFSASQYFSDLAIANPEYFDFLWESGHEALDPTGLRDQLLYEFRSVNWDEDRVMSILRRHRQLELFRIGYRDICLGEPLDRIVASISDLADCLVETALTAALTRREKRHGKPISVDGVPAQVVVLALGKLGGRELNYSSDIDLMIIYDEEGRTSGPKVVENHEFFSSVVQDFVRYLTANTAKGQAYRVDLRLRPQGGLAPLCLSLQRTLAYYDQHGRTWERQALVKVRPIAGNLDLGGRFVDAIQPFVYRRYLNYVEINEIKSMKRKIEAKTAAAGGETTDLKTGHGGIRDIEFVTQFLQLLHGGAKPEIREANTLRALRRLTSAGCINRDEHLALETAYRFLRKAEHRLQFMFDLQTHRIPEDPAALDKVARRLGYLVGSQLSPGRQFLADLKNITDRNRSMLNRLMFDLFKGDESGADALNEPEADLILDPNPERRRIQEVLGPYGFSDAEAAYRGLLNLAKEDVPFLSSVRCRHFLAGVAPGLLRAIQNAPDPDLALVNLERVSASLGAKGVLWESCSVHPALMQLYVQLCSWSQFLSDILIKNPGMIDELLDTLTSNRQPSIEDQRGELSDRLRGAAEIEPILHSFKNTRLLGIGTQDILARLNVQQATRLLAELAEVILDAIVSHHWKRLIAEYGIPALPGDGSPSRFAVVGLGKLGGAELGYHSDLDLVLIYEGDGKTIAGPAGKDSIGNSEFFTELAQRLHKTTSRTGPLGRIYQVDFRLRPTGKSGSLVIPLGRFLEYYDSGKAAFWERLALTRARVVHALEGFGPLVAETVDRILQSTTWSPRLVDEAQEMRQRLQESRPATDIKRGVGGLMDVEFALQLLRLRYGATALPQIFSPNTWDCLGNLERSSLWPRERVEIFRDGYTLLRSVESRIRIVYGTARDSLPESARELNKLAIVLGYEGPKAGECLLSSIERHSRLIRREYQAVLKELKAEAS